MASSGWASHRLSSNSRTSVSHSDIALYPIPFFDFLHINSTHNLNEIRITNLNGKEVFHSVLAAKT
ncbi:MAG: hypothetical protein KDC92_16625, partial [Bacteroidetes bacterium]|nr:hypothetical protein [Bacteroidota bacterium]